VAAINSIFRQVVAIDANQIQPDSYWNRHNQIKSADEWEQDQQGLLHDLGGAVWAVEASQKAGK